MSDSGKERQIAHFRKMQFINPVALLIAAGVVYWALPDHEMRGLFAGILAFLAIPDYFIFKFMADRLENS